MNEFLQQNVALLISSYKQSQFFLSCTDVQWQAYLVNFSNFSFESISDLLSYKILFIFSDIFMYFILLFLIIQFGFLYNKTSARKLLFISNKHVVVLVSVIFIIFCLLFSFFWSSQEAFALTNSYIGGLYQISYHTQVIKFFLLLIWLALCLFLESLAVSQSQGVAEFPILSYMVLCFSFTLVSAGDLALFLICLEGLSLTLYIMATVGRLHGGITAATKYFAFGTAGSILIIWGAVHLYEIISSLSFSALFYVLSESSELVNLDVATKLEWATALILIGFLLKLGAAPMHQWVPDVYSGVPLFVTSFFAIFVKFILYMLFIRFAYLMVSGQELEYAAIISLVVGCFGTLRQVEIKRFLAYGSITHMGFLLTGDLVSSLVYLASYVVASFVFFSVLMHLRVNGQEFIYISDLRYVASARQWDRLLLVFALASMAGLPPFAGFYGKMFIWASLLEDIYLFSDFLSFILLLVNLIVSLIIIFYYMRLVILVFLGTSTDTNTFVSPYSISLLQRGIQIEGKSFFSSSSAVHLSQYFVAALLIFWTLVMPALLTVSVTLCESL